MLDDVEDEVVAPAKAPDGDANSAMFRSVTMVLSSSPPDKQPRTKKSPALSTITHLD